MVVHMHKEQMEMLQQLGDTAIADIGNDKF